RAGRAPGLDAPAASTIANSSWPVAQHLGRATVADGTADHTLEAHDRLADLQSAAAAEAELADRALVLRRAALHHGDRRAHRAFGLEEGEHQRGVGEIAEVDVGA